MVQKASYSFCDAMLHMKVLGKCASYLSKTILSYMSRTHDFEFLVLAHCNGCAILEILSCHIFYFVIWFLEMYLFAYIVIFMVDNMILCMTLNSFEIKIEKGFQRYLVTFYSVYEFPYLRKCSSSCVHTLLQSHIQIMVEPFQRYKNKVVLCLFI